MTKNTDFTFKIVVLGDSGVGKTGFLTRLVDDQFSLESQSTIGVEFKTSILSINGKTIKIQIWDTAGQERYRNIAKQYYNGSNGFLIFYDISSSLSFANLNMWLKLINFKQGENVMICGNKCDLKENRMITTEEGRKFAEENNIMFSEVSAFNGTNVRECFEDFITHIYHKIRESAPETENKYIEPEVKTNSVFHKLFPKKEKLKKNQKRNQNQLF